MYAQDSFENNRGVGIPKIALKISLIVVLIFVIGAALLDSGLSLASIGSHANEGSRGAVRTATYAEIAGYIGNGNNGRCYSFDGKPALMFPLLGDLATTTLEAASTSTKVATMFLYQPADASRSTAMRWKKRDWVRRVDNGRIVERPAEFCQQATNVLMRILEDIGQWPPPAAPVGSLPTPQKMF